MLRTKLLKPIGFQLNQLTHSSGRISYCENLTVGFPTVWNAYCENLTVGFPTARISQWDFLLGGIPTARILNEIRMNSDRNPD